ncbi:MAG: BatA domain-containing protein, partial [Opitutales bacterium]
MTLLSPMWLLSLLALPLLAALYLLKVRPQRKPTNAYFLWQQIFEQKTTSALFRRLRDFLSLLLMLLAFALLALALADPQFKSEDERDLIIVIDSSASMQAIENGRSLLDHAKDEAVDMIRALNGSRQAAIASLDTRLNFQTHLSSHPRELLLAIESVAASDRVLSADAMRQLGAVVATEDSPYRVLFLTDSRHGLESYPDGVEVLSLETEKLPNLGFVAADMQWLPGRSGEASFYCRIINSGSTEAEIDFELVHQSSGAIGKFTSFKIPAGGAIEQVYELAGIEAGVWLAQLIVEDALELDNSLYLGLNPRQPLMVGIDAENSWFFQNCVQAFARAGGILRVANQGGDLRLSEGVIATNAPMRVIFRPEGESKFWSGLGEPLASVVPEVLIPEHPVIEHTELDGFSYANARSLTAPPGSVVLVATEQGVPLIYKASADGEQAVVFNFDPAKEDFFLSPWFPVIVHSAALHLAGRESEFSPVYATGET